MADFKKASSAAPSMIKHHNDQYNATYSMCCLPNHDVCLHGTGQGGGGGRNESQSNFFKRSIRPHVTWDKTGNRRKNDKNRQNSVKSCEIAPYQVKNP